MKIFRSDALIRDGDSLLIFYRPETREEEEHTHDFIEIVYIRSGSAIEYVNAETYAVSRGDLVFINYGSTHRFCPKENFSYINICFHPETLEHGIITPENAFAVLQLTAFDAFRRESDSGMVRFEVGEREEIEAILAAMLREYEVQEESWRTVLESYMNILMVRILRKINGSGELAGTPENLMWRKLCDYIDANLGEDLTLSTLAGKCFYNPSYFSRAFKDKFGMPLSEYITRRKIDLAARLAADNQLSVEEIAARVGFSSRSSLYRAFYKITGVSFSVYRRQR